MKYDHTMTTGCQTCSMGGMSTGTSVDRMVLFPETMEIPTDLFDAVRKATMGVAGTARKGVMTVGDLFERITRLDNYKYKSITWDFLKEVVEAVHETVRNPLMTVTDTAIPMGKAAVAIPDDVVTILAGIKMM